MSLSTFFSLVLILAASGLASAGPKIQNEVPGGTMNGTNAVFQFAAVPIPSSVQLYKNGIRLAPTLDFTLSAKTVVLKFSTHDPAFIFNMTQDGGAIADPATVDEAAGKLWSNLYRRNKWKIAVRCWTNNSTNC